ncbi:MAG: UbiA family prenyltransferase, partial [Saprospiraceae bacterium]|nr:UbiA family prenyltransferase [Saprospiraceae bacterium]
MRNYWTAIRPVNLAIVFASQIIIYLAFFEPLSTSGLILFLWPYKIYAFSFVTMGITAGGYLINDYFDFETDQINKKRKHGLKRIELLGAYYTIFFIGAGMSFWLAYEFGNLLYALIYLAAQGMLFCYASSLKSTILIGNVIVSLFTAGALWIFFIAEQQALDEFKVIHPGEYEAVRYNLLYIGFFIFLLNLIREIVKDIEDVYGDKASGLKTLVIAKGVRFSSAIVRLLSVVLL